MVQTDERRRRVASEKGFQQSTRGGILAPPIVPEKSLGIGQPVKFDADPGFDWQWRRRPGRGDNPASGR
jgi:hypothetical protein